jgi:adenine-specific DNA-methyltransferase
MERRPSDKPHEGPWQAVLDAVEGRRRRHSTASRSARAAMGQFFTPMPTARFMAGMALSNNPHVRLLDAGAGVGSLTAAFVAELSARQSPPDHIAITCFEVDDHLLADLERTLGEIRLAAHSRGVDVTFSIRGEDFVETAVNVLDTSLFAGETMAFDAAILNPPYLKVGSHSLARGRLSGVGIHVSNMYAAFLALSARLLRDDGELIAITPRSFYFATAFVRTPTAARLP